MRVEVALRTALAGAVLLAPTALAFFSGGFFEEPRLWAALVAWVALAAVALLAPRPLPRDRAGLVCIVGLAGLAAWTAVSIAWAPVKDPALGDAERLALYAAYLTCAAALLRGPTVTRAVTPVLTGGALAVCGYALATRLLPDVVDAELGVRAGNRLDQPLTYWNALGAVAAIGLVLALRLASNPGRERWMRVAAAAATPALALALYLTLSRGALAALAVGVAVLVALARDRRALASALIALVAGVLVVAAVKGFPVVESPVTEKGNRQAQGLGMLAVLGVVCALAGAAQSRLGDRLALPAAARRLAVPVVAALALAAAVLAVVAVSGGEKTEAPAGDTGRGPARLPAGSSARLGTLETNRSEYWSVALDGLVEKPLWGNGARSFATIWLEERDVPETVQDAHSLYLETGAELGLVGLCLLALFLGGAAAAAVRLVRNTATRAEAAGWIAAGTVLLTQSALDWDWEVPAVSLIFLSLVGAAIAAADETAAPG